LRDYEDVFSFALDRLSYNSNCVDQIREPFKMEWYLQQRSDICPVM